MSDYDANGLWHVHVAIDNEAHASIVRGAIEEITTLRQQHTTAQAENEALQLRHAALKALADNMDQAIDALCNARNEDDDREADRLLFDSHEAYLIFQEGSFGREADVIILRKQAEAIQKACFEVFAVDLTPEAKAESGKPMYINQDTAKRYFQRRIQSLRTQAAALERQSEGGE